MAIKNTELEIRTELYNGSAAREQASEIYAYKFNIQEIDQAKEIKKIIWSKQHLSVQIAHALRVNRKFDCKPSKPKFKRHFIHSYQQLLNERACACACAVKWQS